MKKSKLSSGNPVGICGLQCLESRTLLSISTEFREVPISAAALAADGTLAGYRSFDLIVRLTGNDRFTAGAFDAVLSTGKFYHPSNSPAAQSNAWSVQPNLEYATFVAINNFQPPGAVLPDGEQNAILTDARFHPAWAAFGGSAGGLAAFTAARLTVSADAVGSIRGEVYRLADAAATSAPFVNSLVPGARALGWVRGGYSIGAAPLVGRIVYDDVNNNHQRDPAEIFSTTTYDGWSLVLPAGAHTLRTTPLAGETIVAPADGSLIVDLAGGQTISNANFVLSNDPPARVTGSVFVRDVLGDSSQTAQSGVTVFIDRDGDRQLDADEQSAITDQAGAFTINNVPPGSVRVLEIPPAGFDALTAPSGYSVGLSPGGTATLQFVNFALGNGALRGSVREAGGSALADVRVYADLNSDGAFQADAEPSTQTLPNGSFDLRIAGGSYVLRQVVPAGYLAVSPSTAAIPANVAPGLPTNNLNFVDELIPVFGSVAGRLSQPPQHVAAGASAALAGWQIFLDTDNDGAVDPGERTTRTAVDGSYSFGNLAAGTFHVRVKKPNGWRYLSTSTDHYAVNIAGGADVAGKDFVYTQRIMIAGTVFDDKNANGVKEAGENGVLGRRVWVDLNNDGLISANEPGGLVGPKGTWIFEDLTPGTYAVRAEPIAGWQNVGSGAVTVTLASGKVKVGVPFGQTQIPALAGRATPLPKWIGDLSPALNLSGTWATL